MTDSLCSEAGVVKIDGMFGEAGENSMIGGGFSSDFPVELVSDMSDTDVVSSTLSTCRQNNVISLIQTCPDGNIKLVKTGF